MNVSTVSRRHDCVFLHAGNDDACGNRVPRAVMISERESVINRYISVPRDMGQINCAAFVAGIIRGVMVSAAFVE